jgi:hypothetical protein
MRIRSTTSTLLGTAAVAAVLSAPTAALAAPVGTSTPGALAPAAVAPATTGERFRNTCNPARAALPSQVEGAPAPFAALPFAPHTGAKALYVWHEPAGWRVRLTHPANAPTPPAADGTAPVATRVTPTLVEVRGRITASRPITAVRTVRLEDRQAGEWVAVQRPGRRAMDFRFVNGGFVDGIDFRAGCAGRLTVTVWEVTRTAEGTVQRTPLPVLFGAGAAPVTAGPPANPAVLPASAEVTRVRVLRTAVATS